MKNETFLEIVGRIALYVFIFGWLVFFSFMIASTIIGGTADIERSNEGVYYVCNRGCQEVSYEQFTFIQIYEELFRTMLLVMFVVFPFIFFSKLIKHWFNKQHS